jgi:hypothetical protein
MTAGKPESSGLLGTKGLYASSETCTGSLLLRQEEERPEEERLEEASRPILSSSSLSSSSLPSSLSWTWQTALRRLVRGEYVRGRDGAAQHPAYWLPASSLRINERKREGKKTSDIRTVED